MYEKNNERTKKEEVNGVNFKIFKKVLDVENFLPM